MEQIRKQYTLTDKDQEEIINRFLDDMHKGLKAEPSTIKMIPSFVTKRPNGTETGDYLALDLGGTNFRVVIYHLHGDRKSTQEEKKFKIPDDSMNGDAITLFDFIAKCVLEMNPPNDIPLGFTFSFPVSQTSITDGTLCHWTKGFTTKGCVGQDPTKLLNEALARQKSTIRVAALVNDTVGTLMAKCYEKPNCLVGVILGTGYNCAYVEMANNIPKWSGSKEGEMLINMECGGFGRLQDWRTEEDDIMDKETPNVGEQMNEKMVSGMYLGELCRLVMKKLVAQGVLFKTATVAPDAQFNTYLSFDTPKLSEVEADETQDLKEVEDVLEKAGIKGSTLEDRQTVKELAEIIATRACILAACDITAICRQMGDRAKGCIVGVDGSLYKLYPHYHDRLTAAMRHLGCDAEVELSEDGSGKGAALIALKASEK